MKQITKILLLVLLATLPIKSAKAGLFGSNDASKPRAVMFVGVDISGSFLHGRYFNDSIDFLAHYIFAHLNGLGGLEQPQALFIGSIGGSKVGEPKTFFPIETFQNKSISEVTVELKKIFPTSKVNPLTDFNAFFWQVNEFVRNRNLVLRPISIVMFTDGFPSLSESDKKPDFKTLKVEPLENLSRNVTIRVLYTRADIAMGWATKVPRKRVKIWSQDDKVMATWRDPKIFLPDVPFEKQERLFSWIRNNVDFPVRAKRVY